MQGLSVPRCGVTTAERITFLETKVITMANDLLTLHGIILDIR
jgi:hypothetical protein